MLAFDISYLLFRQPSGGVRWSLPKPQRRRNAYLLGGAYAALSFISLYYVSGKGLFASDSYSLDYGRVYQDFITAQAGRSHSIVVGVVALAKAALFPFVILTFIDRFRTDRFYVLLIVVPLCISSIFRGTDVELVLALVLLAMASVLHGTFRRRALIYVVLGAVLVGLFGVRRVGRFNGKLPSCLPSSDVCFDYNSWTARHLGSAAEGIRIFLTNYLTNGLEGLSRSLSSLDWTPNWGLGSLPPVKSLACNYGQTACNLPDYQSKLPSVGWDTSTKWTSAYTVIANDVSFVGVVVVCFVLGIIYRRALSSWRSSRDAESGATVVLITMFWIYSSANMQLAINLDWAFATVVFVYAGVLRYRAAPSIGARQNAARVA